MKKPTRMPATFGRSRAAENLGDGRALVHALEHALTAAFCADPSLAATGVLERIGHAFTDQVGPGLNGERNYAACRPSGRREVENPVDPESEDVIGKPDMVGLEGALHISHLRRNVAGAALQVMVAPGRLGAPRAAERAPAGPRHVETEIAMRVEPDRTVTLHVHEIPRGGALVVRHGQNPRAVHADRSPGAQGGDAVQPLGELGPRGIGLRVEPRQELEQGGQTFTEQGDIRARCQINVPGSLSTSGPAAITLMPAR